MEQPSEFILHNLEYYNHPIRDDVCVALCYFNPVGYKSPKENLEIVLESLQISKIPYFTIELVYPNQDPVIKNATKVVRGKTILFSKENLWNILEKNIPKKYSKIIFMDADVKFSNPNWFNLSCEKLDYCDIIQPMDVAYKDLKDKKSEKISLNRENCRYTVAYMVETEGEANSNSHHPGFAIGISRKTFHDIGGFFEYGINGGGDTMFWMALSNFYSYATGKFLKTRKDISIKFYDYKAKIERLNIKVGATYDNMAIHLFHGNIKNRKYLERDRYVDPRLYDNFYYNEDGVLEMMHDSKVYQYFLDRKEDDD